MPGRRLYVTDAIVLSRFDFGEADRILTLLTPELGKIKAIAKGIRRPTSRIGGALEPLAELRVQLAKGRTFDVVTQVTMRHTWLGLRDRLEVTATAGPTNWLAWALGAAVVGLVGLVLVTD
jgi:DNA repair protein RecO (recombination protein O)